MLGFPEHIEKVESDQTQAGMLVNSDVARGRLALVSRFAVPLDRVRAVTSSNVRA